jgi:hypothetical protein
MSVIANDVFSVQAVGSCFGQRIMLTHHYAATGVAGAPDDSTTLDNILAAMSGAGLDTWETLYLACLPPEYTLDFWRVQKVTAVRGAYRIESRGALGTHAHSTETANQAAALTLQGVLGRRDNISVKKIGPLPQDVSVQDSGIITNAYKAKLASLASGMLGTVIVTAGSVTLKACVLHPAPFGSYTLLSRYLQGNTVNTMRRRTVGRGK